MSSLTVIIRRSTLWYNQSWMRTHNGIGQRSCLSEPADYENSTASGSRIRNSVTTSHSSQHSMNASATTLVSVRNTRVFQTALTALTEHRTICRRITHHPLHTYLLYCVVTYKHHQNDRCVTLFAVAAVMLTPFTQRLAMFNAWRCVCLSPAAGSLGMLLVRLEIIATTYRSTIFKTYAFSLYSHICIYVSI